MKKLLIAAALASTAMSTSALARDDSLYVELDAGAMLLEDTHFDIGTTPAATTVGHETGFDIGGIIGYDFGAFRLEAEAGWRRARTADITTSVRIPSNTGVTGLGYLVGSANSVYIGKSEAKSAMLNGLLDFGEDDGLQGFVGGGVGVANVKHEINLDRLGPGWLDADDSGFAWQALAGLRYPVNDVVDLGIKYRFFNVNNVDLVDSAGRATQSNWRSHSVMLTFGFNFGSTPPPPPAPVPVPPPPPPPPPPEPAPPPPPPPCNKGPYIVFFDWDKSDITPEAASILDSAVTAYGNCANVPIMLAGYADRSGKPAYNQGLSERRNASVTAYLTSRGIPGGAISSQGFGENNNRVPTADGVRELQNRRVEITYGPGSGM